MIRASSIDQWLKSAAKQLTDTGISSGRLDAELILTHTLRKNRTYLHAHGDEEIDPRYLDILSTRLDLRTERVPIAYIIGHKEFFGRRFRVTPSTLIPRPESEVMIELLLKDARQPELPLPDSAPRLVDVGTGSGCLGITAKLELPEANVTLLDISRHALTIAEDNAKQLKADVHVIKSNLLQAYPFQADFILANLPYVDQSWDLPLDISHEPKIALFAENQGLALIYRLLEESLSRLTPSGIIYIEADTRQHDSIIKYASTQGFKLHASQGLIVAFSTT